MTLTKEQYFDIKHGLLAEQFKCSPKTIGFLRAFALHRKLSRGQIILWLKERFQKTRPLSKCKECNGTGQVLGAPNPKIEHAEAMKILANISESDWKDIVYPYEYKGV